MRPATANGVIGTAFASHIWLGQAGGSESPTELCSATKASITAVYGGRSASFEPVEYVAAGRSGATGVREAGARPSLVVRQRVGEPSHHARQSMARLMSAQHVATRSLLSDRSGVTDAVRAQLLVAEHWSLLSTRSITWEEMFSRASMFFTVVSAAVVALALVAQATDFGANFRLFAIPLLAVVFLIGLGTYVRLTDSAAADLWLVAGMNRLRHAYLDLAPELEPYLVAGHHDDEAGTQRTGRAGGHWGPNRLLASTPALVGAINLVIASVLVGLLVATAGASSALAAVAGIATGLLGLAAMIAGIRRARARFWQNYQPRFPT